jgi:hypothetical protein
MVPDGQLQGEPTSPMHRLQLGESTFQGREAFDDRSIALDAGGISVMHRFGHNPGGVMNVVHGSAANRSWRLRRQEAEGLPPWSFSSCTYCTVILRGLTVSAFGNVTVKIPWSIFAVIFVESIDGASS